MRSKIIAAAGQVKAGSPDRPLMEHAIGIAEREGWDEIEVGAEKFNKKAIAFYQACGLDEESVLLGKEFERPVT